MTPCRLCRSTRVRAPKTRRSTATAATAVAATATRRLTASTRVASARRRRTEVRRADPTLLLVCKARHAWCGPFFDQFRPIYPARPPARAHTLPHFHHAQLFRQGRGLAPFVQRCSALGQVSLLVCKTRCCSGSPSTSGCETRKTCEGFLRSVNLPEGRKVILKVRNSYDLLQKQR